jgi:hypothetical protein
MLFLKRLLTSNGLRGVIFRKIHFAPVVMKSFISWDTATCSPSKFIRRLLAFSSVFMLVSCTACS